MEQSIIEIFLPVLESSVVLAANYVKATGRNSISAKDTCYGMMYAARYVTGKQIGSMFPEIYEEDEDDESVESESDEPEWIRYAGQDDDTALKMNECYDTWVAWEPASPAERALKAAVDKMGV
jgi:hypothetical protein